MIILGKRIAEIILIVLLPTFFIASVAFASLHTHEHAQQVQHAGYFINSYTEPDGDEFFELTSERRMFGRQCAKTGQKLVLNKVYAYETIEGKLYVLANQGKAVIELTGVCRIFYNDDAPSIVGDDIFVLPSEEAFIPKDIAALVSLPHKVNSYSTRGRNIVESLSCGRFRIEKVAGANGEETLALIDALALESRRGKAVRLLMDVQGYSKDENCLVVRAKNGVGVFNRASGQYYLVYTDNGVYKHLNVASDIEILNSEHELTLRDRARLEKLNNSKV